MIVASQAVQFVEEGGVGLEVQSGRDIRGEAGGSGAPVLGGHCQAQPSAAPSAGGKAARGPPLPSPVC